MIALAMVLALQSLIQDDASPYDPPRKPALKKHDHVLIQFPEAAKAPAGKEARPRWDKELKQWVRFDGKESAASGQGITAEVIDIRPNGTLVLQAIKRRTVNGVEEILRLTGEVAAANVTMNKTSAESIVNLSVVYDGPTSDTHGARVPGENPLAPSKTCRDVRLPAELLS
ncbi:MAG TPA: flagellar basal body L-ring protein FlgH [Planctomycetota bacterium]|nr:flagellar basal body L-ring protein FlgH [Planctomycetota bacterium]